MKKLLLLICVPLLALAVGCSDDGSVESYNSTITPVIEFDDTQDIVAGETYVTFTNASTATGTEIVSYFWHLGFNGEGNWTEDAEPDPVLYNTPGDYTVTLTAWGADGNQASVKRTITVLAANTAPKAAFSFSPVTVYAGTEVTFTDLSTDSDGEIAAWLWTMPDNSTQTTQTATYTFAAAGVFPVTLKVTDDRGASSQVTKSVNVRSGDISDFTVNWGVEVAAATAKCYASVVAVSDLGNVYFTSGEGKIIALDTEGTTMWSYDAATIDKVSIGDYPAYASVDTDGTVYWAAHGVGGGAANQSVVYAFDGLNGTTPLWKNTTAYAYGARISFCTPLITPDLVVVGNRGTDGRIRGFNKSTGKNTATATPANGGANSSTASLKSGLVLMSLSGDYGYGALVPDATFTWSAVPTASAFTPGTILTSNQNQICIGADNCVYILGTVKSGTWNIACFDCTDFSATTTKTPKWTQTLDAGFNRAGASLSADGQTLYVSTDKTAPYKFYALNTANGATRWSYALAAQSTSVPAVDNLGQIHICTMDGYYIVLRDNGTSYTEVYKRQVADSIDGSATISAVNGASYFVGSDGASGKLKVYSVSLPGVTGPAASAWAQYGQNPGHSNYQK